MASYVYEPIELDYRWSRCKCCRFTHGDDLPVPKDLSQAEIASLAAKFSHCIFTDWTKLNAILKRYERTIQKRWLKKSFKQRREILLKARPDMPTVHRPDFIGFRNVQKNSPRSFTCPSAAYLWPYINLEDLQQRHLLLLFLNSRGRNLPEMFIGADLDAAHVGKGWEFKENREWLPDRPTPEKVVAQFFEKPRQEKPSCGCRMQFQNQRSARSYGRLVSESTADTLPGAQLFHPSDGLLGLEIQQGIYSFLLACAMAVLHDIEANQYFLAPHQPAPTLAVLTTNEWPSLTAHMLEAPYGVPQKLDLDRLKILVASRRGSAEDHLWMLREDPGYFSESLKEWKEHDQHMFNRQSRECWRLVAGNMIADSFTHFILWDYIFRKLDSLPTIESQLMRADWTKMRIPKHEERIWAQIQQVVDAFMIISIQKLHAGVPPSPRLRHCYNFRNSKDRNVDLWSPKHDLRDSERRVDLLFHALIYDRVRTLHGTNNLVQELQYMLETDTEANHLVDSWIIGHFSDLALLSELKSRIEGLQPWSGMWKAANVHECPIVQFFNIVLLTLDSLLRLVTIHACMDSQFLGDPTKEEFEYPVSKRYSEAIVNQMRRAESQLDKFWWEMELTVMEYSGLSIAEIVSSRLLELREVYRTAEWIPALVPQKKSSILAEISPNVWRFGGVSSVAVTDTTAKPKTKVKTRGTASSASTVDMKATASQSEDSAFNPQRPIIKVPKRAYKVIAALLPESNAENHQRIEIAWDEMLQALSSIGLQPEKLYGSVWMFKPKEDALVDIKRSIQFHEPKEVRRGGKIPPNMVRTFGRRLKHAYGWEGGMFAVA